MLLFVIFIYFYVFMGFIYNGFFDNIGLNMIILGLIYKGILENIDFIEYFGVKYSDFRGNY